MTTELRYSLTKLVVNECVPVTLLIIHHLSEVKEALSETWRVSFNFGFCGKLAGILRRYSHLF